MSKRGHATSPQFSDMGYVGHWAAVAEELGAQWRILDGVWSADELADVDVLIVPFPEAAGDKPLTERENGLLAAHLEAGRGLLVFGGGDVGAERFADSAGAHGRGVVCGGVTVSAGRRVYGESVTGLPHVLANDVEVALDARHPAAAGVGKVLLHMPRLVEQSPGADPDGAYKSDGTDKAAGLSALVEADGRSLIACGEIGGGRVAAVGNVEAFALPFIGFADNARLLVNLLSWLGAGTVEQVPAQRAADRAIHTRLGPSRALPEPGDLTSHRGDHLIDAAAHGRDFERVTAGGTPDPYLEPDLFLYEAELRYAELPWDVRRAVIDFKRDSNDYGVLLIRNLPTGEVPLTPATPSTVVRKGAWHSEFWLATFGLALGRPFSYRQEKRGSLYQNVVPTAQNADKLSSESSALLLDYHTETAFHPFKPDFVMLYCLRPDHERVARTISAGVRMMLPLLSARERALLTYPLYRTGIDYSFGSDNGRKGNGPVLPVLSGDPFDPSLIYDLDLMIGETEEAESALRSLREAANTVGSWVRLNRGDLLIVDNRRAVHARSEFAARYDGQDRWLQRVCVTVDIARSAAHRRAGSHIVETAFSL